ncbi:MAG: hypothetical protein OEY34_05860 [Cyclobacteriaceae bacterium]|nr:hypothetical protein [Cyclobacteriaceae bacterium]
MTKLISFQFAVKAMLILLVAVMIFHLLILAGVIPFQIVWGGRLENEEEMYRFETVSILVNLFILSVVLIRGGYWKVHVHEMIMRGTLWVLAFLFLMNTVGNIFSVNFWEMVIFTPLTFLSMILCIRMALDKTK